MTFYQGKIMYHSAFISGKKCYVFGDNNYGKLGLGSQYTIIYNPTELTIPNEQIISITCGDDHTVVLTLSRKCYVFGSNEYGQLGLGGNKGSYIPYELTIPNEKIIFVTCGDDHTMILTSSRKCYVFGNNYNGQLGLGHKNNINIPTELLIPNEEITSVIGKYLNSAVLTSSGKCYVCGFNECGQLGLGHNNRVNTLTELVLPNEKIISVACGRDHNMILTFSRKCYVFGFNSDSQLGLKHDNNINVPTLLTNKVDVPTLLANKVDKLMNLQFITLDWNIERLLWLAKMKNEDSKLALLPDEIIRYLRTFLI